MNEMTETQQIDQPLTVVEMAQQVQLIQQVLAQVMKKDTHYGVIPGTGNKPSLLKPGAEKIMATFRLSADPQVLDLSTDDVVRYRITVRLTSPSGRFIGAGIGECSSGEKKYLWRKAVCDAEYDETPIDRRQETWKAGYGNKPPFKQQQIMTNPADFANTILKMAKKRGLVDAVLTGTAASDIFTQELEDVPAENVGTGNNQKAPAGVQAQTQDVSADGQKLIAELTEVANKGWPALQKTWGGLSEVQRASVGSAFGTIKKIADGVSK